MRLSREEEAAIQVRIQHITERSTAKLAVHVDDYCKGDPYVKAINIFNELGFLRHEHQNSIVIYIAKKDKKLAIVTDSKIQENTEELKDEVMSKMTEELVIGRLYPAVEVGLNITGKYLMDHFPVKSDD